MKRNMDILKLKGRSLGQVFNSRSGSVDVMHLFSCKAKVANLELTNWPRNLLGSLP